jgi:hemerythrin
MYKDSDTMIRVKQDVYAIIRGYGSMYKKEIIKITDEALKEWVEKHISKEDLKLINQTINRGKIKNEQ